MGLLLKLSAATTAAPASDAVVASHDINVLSGAAGMFLLVLGLACDAYVIARFLRRRHSSAEPALKVQPKPWGLHELGVALWAVMGLLLVSNAFYWIIAEITHRDILDLASLMIGTEFVLRICVLVGFGLFFHRRGVDVIQALGLRALPPREALCWGVVFGFASLPPVGAIIALVETTCRAAGVELSDQPIVELFTTTDSWWLVATLVVFAVVVAPVFEEFFFRGFAYPALKQRFGVRWAIAIVAVAFALSHLHWPSLGPLVVLAVGLCLVYELTNSLVVPITMHAVFNAVTVARLLYLRMEP